MDTFKVYSQWPIEPVKGRGCRLWDAAGTEYLDCYGGHAVISIGHCHPTYVGMMEKQVETLGFYSNAALNSLQDKLAQELGDMCGYPQYSLFLCNSGAEANENAMKLASFHTGRTKILAFRNAFHGRTSGAVEVTDNPKIRSPFNATDNVKFVPLNDSEAMRAELNTGEYAAAIIEGIQGVGGIVEPDMKFMHDLRKECSHDGTMLILDEVQSGCGRTGRYYAHQHSGINADLVTMAKGIGNGFPIGALIISPEIQAVNGMLGTTFGGNHLACTAALAVLKVMRDESLVENAAAMGKHLADGLRGNKAIKEMRGRGLMIGLELNDDYLDLRNRLLFEKHIFTGASGKNVIRLLPPLCMSMTDADLFLESFNELT
jgi:acetylornithine/N-succinyldiaminopimelate aminotransferase